MDDYKYHSIDWIEKKYGVGQQTVYMWLDGYDIHTGSRMILTSERQRELFQRLVEVDPAGEWRMNDRKIIYPQELDIVSDVRKIAIEYCGIYWHSEIHKKDTYHLEKLNKCEATGYRLVTMFESDDIDMIVQFIHQPTIKVGARLCDLVYGVSTTEFELQHHLMGNCNANVTLALVHEGSTVSTMTFSKNRYGGEAEWEMIRYTTSDIAVVGGKERLFHGFVSKYDPTSVITYCDRRYGTGKAYASLGFTFSHNTKPNYWYSKRGYPTIYSRQMFMKHKLVDRIDEFDPSLTERENMLNNGYYRIYDCGSSAWLWTK